MAGFLFQVDNLTRFLAPVGGILQFIHASDRDDYTHLFHYTAKLDEGKILFYSIRNILSARIYQLNALCF